MVEQAPSERKGHQKSAYSAVYFVSAISDGEFRGNFGVEVEI